MDTSYLPVQYYYIEAIEQAIKHGRKGKVFFFNDRNEVDSAEGKVVALREIQDRGFFLTLDPEAMIRIDRIITLFGKPGAAYDEYDAYANQCLSCTGGYDMESLP